MALIQAYWYSQVLRMDVPLTAVLPHSPYRGAGSAGFEREGGRHSVLYLLHGFTDNETAWTRKTSVERYAADKELAVVMPNVHHSFYTDMAYGNRYWTFLSEELPFAAEALFHVSGERDRCFVAGLSMGGYGAFLWALRQPERFRAAASFSGALDLATHVRGAEEMEDVFRLVFGGRDVAGTEYDLLRLAVEDAERPGERTQLYQYCGTEDFLYGDNLAFRDACRRSGRALDYFEGPGGHDWAYWDVAVRDFIERLPAARPY